MQDWFNIQKSINVIHHLNGWKKKNHTTISIDVEKAPDNTQHPFMIKTQKTMNRGELLQPDKESLQKNLQLTYLMKNNVFLPKIRRNKTRISTLITVFNIVLEVLASTIMWEKEIKGTHLEKKEMELSVFAEDMKVYVENPKESTKRLLQLISYFRCIEVSL